LINAARMSSSGVDLLLPARFGNELNRCALSSSSRRRKLR
jgi:hypothetical protein